MPLFRATSVEPRPSVQQVFELDKERLTIETFPMIVRVGLLERGRPIAWASKALPVVVSLAIGLVDLLRWGPERQKRVQVIANAT